MAVSIMPTSKSLEWPAQQMSYHDFSNYISNKMPKYTVKNDVDAENVCFFFFFYTCNLYRFNEEMILCYPNAVRNKLYALHSLLFHPADLFDHE